MRRTIRDDTRYYACPWCWRLKRGSEFYWKGNSRQTGCKECRRFYERQRRADKSEIWREQNRANCRRWWTANREKMRQRYRDWVAAISPENRRALWRKQANRQYLMRAKRRWKQKAA